MGFQLWLKVLEILIVRILELIGHLALKEMLGGLDPPVWTAHLKEFNIDNIIQEQCHLLHKNNSATRHLRGKLIRRFRSGQDKLPALSPPQAPALIHFWCELLMKESGPDGVSTAKQQKMESKQYSDWWMLAGIVNKNLNLMCNCISIETPICIQPSSWHVGCQAKDPTLDEPELPLANM